MVKGVNRTVIEVNDTGNKYFNKVIFFVSPEYSALPTAKLENRAKEYIGTLDKRALRMPQPKRRAHKVRNIILSVGGVLAVAATALIIFL